jgi:hypothetical protein
VLVVAPTSSVPNLVTRFSVSSMHTVRPRLGGLPLPSVSRPSCATATLRRASSDLPAVEVLVVG